MGGGIGAVLRNTDMEQYGLVGVLIVIGLLIVFRTVISQFVKRTLFGRGRQDAPPQDMPRRGRRRRWRQ